MRDAVISGNRVSAAALDPYHPGVDCDGFGAGLAANGCEPFSGSHVLVTMTDSEDAGCRPELSWNVALTDDNSWVKDAAAATNRARLFFGQDDFRNSSDRMNRANLLHTPSILPSYRGVKNVADFRSNCDRSSGSTPVYIDLLSHWNGAVPPTDGVLVGSADVAIAVQLMVPASTLPATDETQVLLSIGQQQYERLDMQLEFKNATTVTVRVAWMHNDSDHVTALAAPLAVDQWQTVELAMTHAAYVNSTQAVCVYGLYVGGQLVQQQRSQQPPKKVIPAIASVGYSPRGTGQPFTGLLQRLTIRRSPETALQ